MHTNNTSQTWTCKRRLSTLPRAVCCTHLRGMVEAVPQLISWLESRGGRLRDIEAGEVAQGGRGIVATRDIAPGACVLEVPFPCLMTCSSALACPTVSAVVNAGPHPLTPFQVGAWVEMGRSCVVLHSSLGKGACRR